MTSWRSFHAAQSVTRAPMRLAASSGVPSFERRYPSFPLRGAASPPGTERAGGGQIR